MLLVAILVTLMFYRKWKIEQEIEGLLWKINIESLLVSCMICRIKLRKIAINYSDLNTKENYSTFFFHRVIVETKWTLILQDKAWEVF